MLQAKSCTTPAQLSPPADLRQRAQENAERRGVRCNVNGRWMGGQWERNVKGPVLHALW